MLAKEKSHYVFKYVKKYFMLLKESTTARMLLIIRFVFTDFGRGCSCSGQVFGVILW